MELRFIIHCSFYLYSVTRKSQNQLNCDRNHLTIVHQTLCSSVLDVHIKMFGCGLRIIHQNYIVR